ncbi:DUF3306 domain-containing protein [Phreatobacter sp.]|uniref:DUF3306 domain-containing protein n=1 Tax=Phreatobacter sp. TaxID=1966341 RepID=UPI003F6F8C6B
MSGGEGGFLSRWSRLKREQAEQEATQADSAGSTPSDPDAGAAGPDPERAGENLAPQTPLEDLIESLPKIEDLVPGQDVSAFMQAWVPSDLRHAALRRMWLVDPAIRDYVSPALDYAYDYNNPSSIAGFGPMETSADQIREVMDMFDRAVAGKGADESQDPDPKSPEVDETKVVEAVSQADAATGDAAAPASPPIRSVAALREGDPPDDETEPAPTGTGSAERRQEAGIPVDGRPPSQPRDAAPHEKMPDTSEISSRRRRHGGALPG